MTEKIENKQNQITCRDVADYFIAVANEAGEPMTNLKLQKLVYYAQAWFLANFSRPLFEDDFEAWVHGPVIPMLYRTYKERGSLPIVSEIKVEEVEQKFNVQTRAFLGEVARVYMAYGAYQLELMTHEEEPWLEARSGCEADEKCSNLISKKSMEKFYGKRLRDKAN